MSLLRSSFLRVFFALALPLALVAQLVAIPAPSQAKAVAWMEICTVEGMVKRQIDRDGAPVEQAPAHGHEHCDLCLPSHAAAAADAPTDQADRTLYAVARQILDTDAPVLPVQTGPPIGPRAPPTRS